MDLKNKKIGVLMGGFSSEREISLRSGKNVLSILKDGGYNAIGIDVKDDFVSVLQKEQIDVAFNVLHGYFGEDGRVQSILEFLKVPYTGSGVEASAVAMNKVLSKDMATLAGVKTASFKIIHTRDDFNNIDFDFPWVVKPASEGSSIGIYLIHNQKELDETQFDFSLSLFVEEFVSGTEVTVGVLDDGVNQKALPVLQLVPKNEFYDFEAKYTKGLTDFILPAEIEEKLYTRVQEQSVAIHKMIGCKGCSRSDFIVTKKDAYFLEINTNPGMTETSDVPAQANAAKMTQLELCEKILNSALIKEI